MREGRSRYPAMLFLEPFRATLMRGCLRVGGCDDSFAADDARLLSMVHRDDTAGGAAVVKKRGHLGDDAGRLPWPRIRLPALKPQSIVRLN